MGSDKADAEIEAEEAASAAEETLSEKERQRQRLQRRRCRGRRAIAGQEKRAAKAADCGVADVQVAEA